MNVLGFIAAVANAVLVRAHLASPTVDLIPVVQFAPGVKKELLSPPTSESLRISRPSMKRCAAYLCALCVLVPNVGLAQLIGTDKTYDERLRGARNVVALDETLFGDKINLQDGSVVFEQDDVVLATNSDLRVQIGRRTPAGSRGRDQAFSSQGLDREFAVFGIGWELNVPYMMGTYDSRDGWNVDDNRYANRRDRCSTGKFTPYVNQPSTLPYEADPLVAHMYWNGVKINIPGQGEELLLRVNSGQAVPENGKTYVGTTKSSWRISCLSGIKNGSGEGFAAVLPDGTTYYFDWMAIRDAVDLTMTGTTDHNGDYWDEGDLLAPLSDVFLYATKIEDRFGNFVSYTYDENHPNRIKHIESSDGVRLDVEYNTSGQIYRVKSDSRTWTYSYETFAADNGFKRLSSVELPDGSRWGFSFQRRTASLPEEGNFWRNCAADPGSMTSDAPVDPDRLSTMTMTHPSGATGEFRFLRLFHGTNDTPGGCQSFTTGQFGLVTFGTHGVPSAYAEDSLYEKKISGPGVPNRIWNYMYYPSWSFSSQCSNGCPTTSRTMVQTNDGVVRRFTFGNSYSLNLAQLLGETVEQNGGVRIAKSYAYLSSASGQPFPDNAGAISAGGTTGWPGDGYNYGNPFAFKHRPLRATTTVLDGISFSRSVNAFDSFVRPLSVTKSNTIPSNLSKTEITAYHDSLSRWVLGQPAKLTVNGIVASEVTYSSYAQPLTFKSFGKLQETRTYDVTTAGQRGTIRTVKDGNGNITTLSNWKRGIPQSIAYADGTTQSAIVNDAGWITRVTDENGFATNYAYDAMGRLSRTTYPTGDSTAWNVTNSTFAQATSSAYGIPAGHWQHTIATGNGRKVTYFDALWRPLVVREYDTGSVSATQRFTRYAYDSEGRRTFVSYPSTVNNPSTGVHTIYDALGRVTRVKQDSELGILSTTTSYLSNADGYYTLVTDPKGNQTRTWYQAFDQPSYDNPVAIMHPEGVYTHITRDVFGKPVRIRRSNSSTSTGGTTGIDRTYTYNANHELCRTVEPETGATLMGYDAAGNLAWSASGLPAGTACHATGDTAAISARRAIRGYDARNRIEFLSFPDNRGNTVYTYTPDGLPETIEANNGGGNVVTTTYNYNRRRLLTSERMAWGAIAWTLGTGYNANGHVVSHSYPVAGSIGYAPNALGQPTQVGNQVTGVTYHPNGAPKQFTYGNGIVHTMLQNGRGLPDSRADAYSSTRFLHDEYDYDPNGNVAAITDGATGRNQRGNRDMEYDGLDRLTSTTSPMFGTATYRYDVLDNLTQVKLSGGTAVRDHHYCYDTSWRLTSIRSGSCGGSTVTALGYDEQGNLSNRGGVRFGFDYGNRLRSSSAGNTTYVYDGLGRRVRDATGASRYSLYNQAGQLVFTSDHRKKLQTNYFYLGDRLVAQIDRSTVAPTGVPTLTVPASNTSGSFTASWTEVDIAERYELEQRKDGGTWSRVYSGIGLSRSITGLSNGSYEYRVRACTAAGCAGYSAIKPTSVVLLPGGAPVVTTPTSDSDGAFTVSWTAVTGAASYRLEQRKDGGAWVEVYSGAALSKAISGLSNGSYDYRAQACNSVGCAALSGIVTTVVTFLPAGVPTVTTPAIDSDGTYTVSWTSVVAATSYRLQQRKDGGSFVDVYNGAGFSKMMIGMAIGTYDYRVRACNAGGCAAYSSIATTVVAFPPTGVPTLTAPATDSNGAYTVSWTSVSAATSYRLEQRKDSGSWSQIYSGSSRSKAISGLGSGSYAYRVRACNAGGCAAFSAIKTTVVTHPPGVAPTLTAPASSSNGSFTVSWTSVSGATHYSLWQRKDGSGFDPWQSVYSGAALSKAMSGLASGRYEYQVKACNSGGCGSDSAVKVTVVTHPPGSAPAVTAPASDGDGAFTVSWTSVSTATSYRLEQRKGSGSWSQIYSGSSRSMAISRLGNGSYGYRARACNAGGCSGYSAIKTTTVAFAPSGIPTLSAPAFVNSYLQSSYTVSWTSVATATRYELQRHAGSGTWSGVYNAAGTSSTFTSVLGYWSYRVRACNAGGCGSFSSVKTVAVENMGGCRPGEPVCQDPLSLPEGEQL